MGSRWERVRKMRIAVRSVTPCPRSALYMHPRLTPAPAMKSRRVHPRATIAARSCAGSKIPDAGFHIGARGPASIGRGVRRVPPNGSMSISAQRLAMQLLCEYGSGALRMPSGPLRVLAATGGVEHPLECSSWDEDPFADVDARDVAGVHGLICQSPANTECLSCLFNRHRQPIAPGRGCSGPRTACRPI